MSYVNVSRRNVQSVGLSGVLLAQGSSGASGAANANPLSTLLDEWSGSDATTGSPPPALASTGTTGGPSSSFDPGTMAALLSLQDQSATGTQGPSQFFAKLDTDGNGQISQSEFETALGSDGVDKSSADALFSKLDANGDGSISQSELTSATNAPGQSQLFSELDTNGDGQISRVGIRDRARQRRHR